MWTCFLDILNIIILAYHMPPWIALKNPQNSPLRSPTIVAAMSQMGKSGVPFSPSFLPSFPPCWWTEAYSSGLGDTSGPLHSGQALRTCVFPRMHRHQVRSDTQESLVEPDLRGQWRHFQSLSLCQASQEGQDPGLWMSILSHSHRYYVSPRIRVVEKTCAYVHVVIHSCAKMATEHIQHPADAFTPIMPHL